MIINPVACVLGNVAHDHINTLPICPGAVQKAFKGVAATVRGSWDAEAFSQPLPNHPVLGF